MNYFIVCSYDSLRLGAEELETNRQDYALALAGNNAPVARTQEQQLDFTYWVFEGETPQGVYGTAESIRGMKEALDLFTSHPDYPQYCWLEYPEDESTAPSCRPPLSSLYMYYASSWNPDAVQSVIDQLSTDYPTNVDRYNDLSLCVESDLLCDEVPASYTEADYSWARALHANITSIMATWDGQGTLQEDSLDQVTEFAAYMMALITKRGFVDFGFDKDFSIENQVSQYSRAIFRWGGPLNSTQDTSTTLSEEDREDEDESQLKEYVYVCVCLWFIRAGLILWFLQFICVCNR